MIAAVLMLIVFVMCPIGMLAIYSVRKELKQSHPDIFGRIYRSTSQVPNDFRFAVFLLSGSYAACVGFELKKKMQALRIYVLVYMLVFVAAVFAMAQL